MKTFEKLGLSKFEDYKLNKVMTAKIIGGEHCTGGGFELISSGSKIEGNNVVYTNVFRTWQSDTSDCGRIEYHQEEIEPHSWETPRA